MAGDDDNPIITPGRVEPDRQTTDVGRQRSQSGDVGSEVATTGGLIASALAAIRYGGQLSAQQIIALAEETGKISIPVRSNCIASVEYNVSSGDMEITFVDGSVYYYPNTTMFNFLEFINSESKGSFYNRFLRGAHNLIMGKKKGWKMPLG